jgi:hypothetical protein
MKRLLVSLAVLALLIPAVPAGAGARPVLRVGKSRNVMGTGARITLFNKGDSVLTFENPWVIRDSQGQPHGRFVWVEGS